MIHFFGKRDGRKRCSDGFRKYRFKCAFERSRKCFQSIYNRRNSLPKREHHFFNIKLKDTTTEDMRHLRNYLEAIETKGQKGDLDPVIASITFDSRKAVAGSIFVAMRGTAVDGHTFIPNAIEAGCNVVVCEEYPQVLPSEVTFIQVKDSSVALAQLAAYHYHHPAHKLQVVGVTGTNGKTTIATLLYRLALKLGYNSGLCSTVANYIGTEKSEATLTTPDALTLQKLMAQMVEAGCEYCFMEVSSHALDQQRVAAIPFVGGIFTNLSHDHLDYHKTFDAYIKAKKTFFDQLSASSFALSNADDKNGAVMLQNTPAKKKYYSARQMADFRVKVIESLFEGMHLEINNKEVWTPFIGRFNASNLVAVYAAAILLGWESDDLLPALSSLKSVDGRFETIRSKNGITAVVDYAHTPDALKNVLETLNQIRSSENDLISVVGAGGNRDPFKRPLMAAEAVKFSTKIILTSDNPRFEEPEVIIEEMKKGVAPIDQSKVLSITNRREAIRTACSMARPGDVVLVAGKGHETYQEIKGVRTHFDDREIIREFFDQI